LIGALEEGARASKPKLASWAAATAFGAGVAALGGAFGLRAIHVALLPGAGPSWLIPLVALPLAIFAIVRGVIELRRERADERERAAVAIAIALEKVKVPSRIAFEAGATIAALDSERARALEGADRRVLAMRKSGLVLESAGGKRAGRAVPAIAAVWAVASFWILYFGAVASSMLGGILE
jgi:hypothetical protein